MKYTLFLAFLATILMARENPFVPSGVAKSDINSTNIITKPKDFTSLNINLPSDARELSHISVHYKSVDGSIKTKNYEIDSSIDWHDTLVLAKQQAPQTTQKEMLDVSVTTGEPGGTTKPAKSITLSDAPQVSAISAPSLESALETFDFANLFQISIFSSKIVINTNDMLLKSYDDGSRIVLDFKKSGGDFLTKSVDFKNVVLKKMIIGSHQKFYRVVLQLDKKYKYSIRQNSDNYTIWLGK